MPSAIAAILDDCQKPFQMPSMIGTSNEPACRYGYSSRTPNSDSPPLIVQPALERTCAMASGWSESISIQNMPKSASSRTMRA